MAAFDLRATCGAKKNKNVLDHGSKNRRGEECFSISPSFTGWNHRGLFSFHLRLCAK